MNPRAARKKVTKKVTTTTSQETTRVVEYAPGLAASGLRKRPRSSEDDLVVYIDDKEQGPSRSVRVDNTQDQDDDFTVMLDDENQGEICVDLCASDDDSITIVESRAQNHGRCYDEEAALKILATSPPDESQQQDEDATDYREYLIEGYMVYDKHNQIQELTEHSPKTLFISGNLKQAPQDVGVRVSWVQIGSDFCIGGLDSSDHAPWAWVRSELRDRVWYRLGRPKREYKDLGKLFAWKCGLVKHLLDFLEAHFTATFSDCYSGGKFGKFLKQRHGQYVRNWCADLDAHDFSQDITTHAQFIYWQISNLTLNGLTNVDVHTFWQDRCFNEARRKAEVKPTSRRNFNPEEKTVVTPLVNKFFKVLYGKYLRVISREVNVFNLDCLSSGNTGISPSYQSNVSHPQPSTSDIHPSQTSISFTPSNTCFADSPQKELVHGQIKFQDPLETKHSKTSYARVEIDAVTISVGDFVELEAPKEENDPLRIGRVMELFEAVQLDPGRSLRKQGFRILWLYHASKTILANMCDVPNVAHTQELFYSWHCECLIDHHDQPIESIVRKVNVTFGKSCQSRPHHYFVNRLYDHRDGGFEDLDLSMLYHPFDKNRLRCGHHKPSPADIRRQFFSDHKTGDFVLLQRDQTHRLYCLHKIESINGNEIELRMMPRLEVVIQSAIMNKQPSKERVMENEVVYCAMVEKRSVKEVLDMWGDGEGRWCHVEFAEYEQMRRSRTLRYHGAGNFFFFNKHYDPETNNIYPISNVPKWRLKYPPWQPSVMVHDKKMRILELFCGGGSFGRAFEDAEFAVTEWAVDVDDAAMRTHARNSKSCNRFTSSINVLMREALVGRPRAGWPTKGEVDIILAGSPCQGYSMLNSSHKHTAGSLTKSSLIASVATAMDLYRPRYLLLENVGNLIRLEAFTHFVAFLFEIRYQIRWSCEDASHYGVAQKRVRLFLWAAASGNPLPPKAQLSHHSGGQKRNARMELPNGKRIGEARECTIASFEPPTIERAIGHLPLVSDWDPRYPDHIVGPVYQWEQRIMDAIPTSPEGAGLQSLETEHPVLDCNWGQNWLRRRQDPKLSSKPFRDYERVRPDDLSSTITTTLRVNGPYAVPCMHWKDARLLSVHETKLLQGFLEEDVIEGEVVEKYRIVGNAVPRAPVFAMAVMLAEALKKKDAETVVRGGRVSD